jgi:hypothetical protein
MSTDWLPELTDDDLATLLDALEAWETKGAAGEMFGDLLEAVIADKDARTGENIRSARAREKDKAAREKRLRKEQSVILRAKLLTLRDRRRIERDIIHQVKERE